MKRSKGLHHNVVLLSFPYHLAMTLKNGSIGETLEKDLLDYVGYMNMRFILYLYLCIYSFAFTCINGDAIQLHGLPKCIVSHKH